MFDHRQDVYIYIYMDPAERNFFLWSGNESCGDSSAIDASVMRLIELELYKILIMGNILPLPCYFSTSALGYMSSITSVRLMGAVFKLAAHGHLISSLNDMLVNHFFPLSRSLTLGNETHRSISVVEECLRKSGLPIVLATHGSVERVAGVSQAFIDPALWLDGSLGIAIRKRFDAVALYGTESRDAGDEIVPPQMAIPAIHDATEVVSDFTLVPIYPLSDADSNNVPTAHFHLFTNGKFEPGSGHKEVPLVLSLADSISVVVSSAGGGQGSAGELSRFLTVMRS